MELRRSSHYDCFEISSKRDIKSISNWFLVHHSLVMMRILENFGKLAMKYKLGLRLFCSLHPRHRVFGALSILSSVLGYSRKNPNRRVEDILLGFFTFLPYPWKFQIKQSSAPRYSTELCQIPWKFQGQNLNKLLEFPHCFFLVTLWKSSCVFNQPLIPLDIHQHFLNQL